MSDKNPLKIHESSKCEITGSLLKTSIAMEPGAKYGDDCPDSYSIDVKDSKDKFEFINFSSIEEMEEFRDQLTKYIESHRSRGKTES